ncbi:translation initiation factor IF-2-like [Lynx canadensis]|uniref:translation initiation factor IF-2-like n=1 Tax=Lynx canadensis TaxID=61383 RepID=UPI000C2FDA43|nr:translation initiation factor IF-2-like [Lynx canadensis]
MPAPRGLGGHPGPGAPRSLCGSRRGNTRPGGQGHDRDAKNSGETRAPREETTRRSNDSRGENTRCAGDIVRQRCPGAPWVSQPPPPPRAAGAGPRGAARRWTSAQGRPGPRSARPSSPPRPFTPERRRRSRVCPAEGEGRARGGGGGVVVPLQRGLLCPCAEMTHGVPSRHARAQRTDTHKERGKYTAPSRRPQQLPGPPRPGPPRAAPALRPRAPPPPHVAPKLGAGPLCKVQNSRPR